MTGGSLRMQLHPARRSYSPGSAGVFPLDPRVQVAAGGS